MIKAVLFDYGGVLSVAGRQGFIAKAIAELYHVPLERVDITDWHGDLRRGRNDADKLFQELDQRFGGHVTKKMFVDYIASLTVVSRPVIALAAQLRTHGIRTGILSNVFAMNGENLKQKGVYDGFDPVILSYEVGYAKPDAEIYTIALERLKLPANEVLFIDDQEKCLQPARELGMHVITAASPGQIVADTKALVAAQNGLKL